MTDEQIGEKFAKADADNDGQVSLEEFKNHKKSMKPMMKEWAEALKEKVMGNEKFVKMLMGQTPADCHIPMLNMCFKKKMKICERLGLDMEDESKMKENMMAFMKDDEGLCAMACWKMCLFDKNGDMSLDKTEFTEMNKAMCEKMGKEFDENDCNAKWAEADADKDGKVSMCELKAFLKKCCDKME